MSKKKISYVEASEEIEKILLEIEHGELDVDVLSLKVKRVSSLLKLCNDMLKKTEQDVENILNIIKDGE